MDDDDNDVLTPHDNDPAVARSYFEAHKGAVNTSNFTLNDLTIYSAHELSEALHSYDDPHVPLQEERAQQFRDRFPHLEYLLDAGHSLLVHGFGSKKQVLDQFAHHLSDTADVVVVNGFNPTLNVRSTLSTIATQILHLKSFSKRSLFDYVDAIVHALDATNKPAPLTLVVHNLDGPALRAPDVQLALSRVAQHARARLVASVDHVNAPLLWDATTYAAFAWMWVRCETLRPYDAETLFSEKPLSRGGGELRVEGAVAFLNSLSAKARLVFRYLAGRQIGDNGNNAPSSAAAPHVRTTFNQLFEVVKEKFWMSDQATLRQFLNEMGTHDMLQTRRGADAVEQLWIPLQAQQLENVLKQID